MKTSTDLGKIALALVAFQSQVGVIPKDQKVTVTMKDNKGRYQYSYASREDILKVVLPVLNANGIFLLQVEDITDSGKAVMTTRLQHTSGEFMESHSPFPDGGGRDPKEWGGLLTYAARYALMILGIVISDDDLDRQDATQARESAGPAPAQKTPPAAPGSPPPPANDAPTPSARIVAAMKDQGLTQADVMKTARGIANDDSIDTLKGLLPAELMELADTLEGK
jgi:hypothetical protein